MTYWQKLCTEYPDIAHKGPTNKDVKCPSVWGYEERIRGECMRQRSCEACWDRQMPEETK